MAKRRGNALDFTGVEPGAFPVVPEGEYAVELGEMYIYTKETGMDVLAIILSIVEGDQEGQKLFSFHGLTENSKNFVLATLVGLGFVTDDDRGPDNKARLVIDYEVEQGKNSRGADVDIVTDVVVNDTLRSTANRSATATVRHKVEEDVDDNGKKITRTRVNVTKLVPTGERTTSRTSRKKFGR